jgi:leucyl-tRNA synthetase
MIILTTLIKLIKMPKAKETGLDFKKIEKKWQKLWEKQKLYEANVDEKKKKFFITFPYPYMNGAPHVGHSYTSFRTDAYARFKRLQGYNVLYPQGWHATGEPIIGVIERLKKGDTAQAESLKQFGATQSDIKKFMKDPKYLVEFFIAKWTDALKSGGMSIDWRRSFVTTSLTPTYSRFIEWQYNTLKKKGYVVQGTHPVIWCPKDKSPTGDHDRLEGEGESPQDFVLLKFKIGDYILPAATLRPETIYGVTNMWLNPDSEYVIFNVNKEKWIVSKYAAEKLLDQIQYAKIENEFDIGTIIGKKCIEPINNREIPILPSHFVDPENATGVVMSVPSHAPYDWIALKELIDGNELEQYGLTEKDIIPVSLVKTPGLGEHPALEITEKMGITSTKQGKELDEATNIVYKKEFHQGILNEKCGPYSGIAVNSVKDNLILDFIEKGIADTMWEPTGKVVCRCTTRCHVKILENQWFLKFSDENWKKDVKRHLKTMNVYPEDVRNNFENTIDWLKDKACTRRSGLGTQLPWDKSWIVETLSDSTIYMAYYTISRMVKENKITAEQLTDEAFNYIFLGKGDLYELGEKTKIKKSILQEMREEFEYFYPVDMRNSGKDLIQNHLTFYIFHHTAIWPENKWPRAIGVNGYVNVEGEKMSKSKGNFIPLSNMIDQFGADLVRINIVCSSEGIEDADWRSEGIKGYKSRLEFIEDLTSSISKAKSKEERNIDEYLKSKINKCIMAATENFEQMKFRTAMQHGFFETTNDLKWYLRRVGDIKNANKKILTDSLEKIIKMSAPLVPHFAEEMWSLLGNKKSIFLSEWPQAEEIKSSQEVEMAESMLKQTIADVEDIQKLAKIENPKTAKIFVAENWKFRVYNQVLKNKDKSVNEITKEIMSSGGYGQATVAYIQSLYKKIGDLRPIIPRTIQINLLEEAKGFMEKELKLKIEIIDAEKSHEQKARQAVPQKFGILLE